MSEYKIQAIAGQVREYDTQFGPMKSYTLKLEGEMDPVELSQKASTPAPEAGQTLNGDITEGKFGKKFKKEYNQGGFGGSPTNSIQRVSEGKPAYAPRDDSHIKAQWAIGQAVGTFDWTSKDREPVNLDLVEDRARHFFAMVDRVKGSVTADTSGNPPKPQGTSDEVLAELFPDVEPEGETPWNPGN